MFTSAFVNTVLTSAHVEFSHGSKVVKVNSVNTAEKHTKFYIS